MLTGPGIVWRDSSPNKFYDALAAGKPVASNYEGWSAGIARDAGAGMILPAEDIDKAADMIVAHVLDRDWLQAAGTAARSLAEERFDRDMLAAQLADVLSDAICDWTQGDRPGKHLLRMSDRQTQRDARRSPSAGLAAGHGGAADHQTR